MCGVTCVLGDMGGLWQCGRQAGRPSNDKSQVDRHGGLTGEGAFGIWLVHGEWLPHGHDTGGLTRWQLKDVLGAAFANQGHPLWVCLKSRNTHKRAPLSQTLGQGN